MQAACYGHLACVVLLLQSGANMNLRNRWGSDVLVAAAQGGFGTIVQVRGAGRRRGGGGRGGVIGGSKK